MKFLFKRFLLVIVAGSFGGTMSAQKAQQEANLKAAFIYNFTKYIDWGHYSADSIFVIGVAGDSPIIESLGTLAASNRINNKRIMVKTINSVAEISNCDIVFISKKCRMPLNFILAKTGPGVLTIGEQPGFAEAGTAFNFVVVNNRLKFEANLKAISSAGLKAGSQLLKLAIIVD
ncbi:MAG: YfiR family protein [Ginsengibacter sp.]